MARPPARRSGLLSDRHVQEDGHGGPQFRLSQVLRMASDAPLMLPPTTSALPRSRARPDDGGSVAEGDASQRPRREPPTQEDDDIEDSDVDTGPRGLDGMSRHVLDLVSAARMRRNSELLLGPHA